MLVSSEMHSFMQEMEMTKLLWENCIKIREYTEEEVMIRST